MSAVTERVRKLLALAESPNEYEAASAAEKAQALMLQHGIDMASVALSDGYSSLTVGEARVTGKVDPWRRNLAATVADSAGGRMVFSQERGAYRESWKQDYGCARKSTGEITFYGPAGSVRGMVELYRYLERQLVAISATATANREENWIHGRTYRASFLHGAVARLDQRLEARRESMAQEASINSQALVVVKSAVDRHVEQANPTLTDRRSQTYVNWSAYEAGEAAGDHVNLGDGELKGRQELAA